MERLDFFITEVSDAPVKLDDGQYTDRLFDGPYNKYHEFCVRQGNHVLFYYGIHHNNQTTFFIYPGDSVSEMFDDIIKNIDIYNLPSVRDQWPNFGKAYDNYKNDGYGKIKLYKVRDAYERNITHITLAFTLNKHIEFTPTYIYREHILSLINFSANVIEEVVKDNGFLNGKGFFSSFMRGASRTYLVKKLFKLDKK